MSIDINNATSVYAPNHQYATPKGDIKTLVKAMRSHSNDFENRDLVGELHTVSAKDTVCKAGSPKQPSIKFLNSVEKELKQANAAVKGTTGIASEYAKLLHNKHHLNQAYQKLQAETILSTLRSGDNTLTDIVPPVTNSLQNTNTQTIFPMGKITPSADISPEAKPVKYDIQKPDATYSLAPAPDIFSEAKAGNHVTYKIVPFNYVAGS